jgi:carbamoyltransferase
MGYASSHDSCVCLLRDDEIVASIAVERLVRVKRAVVTAGLERMAEKRVRAGHLQALRACCEVAGIEPGDIHYVSVASPDSADQDQLQLDTALFAAALPNAHALSMPHPEHHLAHAYSAFFTSGYESAVALVADCFGTPVDGRREEQSCFRFDSRDDAPGVVFRHLKPDAAIVPRPTDDGHAWIVDRETVSGLGEIYRLVTILLGFYQPGTKFDDAGKTMGLAPYGRRLSAEPILMRPTAHGTLDFSEAFPFFEGHNLITRANDGLRLSVRGAGSPLSRFHQDLAAQVQWELEEAALHLARHAQSTTGSSRLVLAGGVFLNAVANRRIVREAGFDEVYVVPAATDDGTAVGAAYYAYQHACREQGRPARSRRLTNVGLGKSYDADAIAQELQRWPTRSEQLSSLEQAADQAGALLGDGKIVGWFQGGSELGPRALGRRSILADPQDPAIKDTLNARVKFREGFRPFAPAVLAERASEIFEMDQHEREPFMLQIFGVREPYRERLPGVTHVDGTARVQTVTRTDDPLLHRVITEYARRRGLPVVVNTSFNLKGMPIVDSPANALACFVMTEMDHLVMGRHVVPMPDRMEWVPVSDPRTRLELRGVLGELDLQLGVTIGGRLLTHDEFVMLRMMDGVRSVRELARACGRGELPALRLVLKLMRLGWCRWDTVPDGNR